MALVLSSLVLGINTARAQTQGVNVSLNSSSSQVKKGDSLQVVVDLTNQSSQITIAEINIGYDTSKLSFKNFDFSNSSFESELPALPGNSNSLVISRYNTAPISGNAVIGTINFDVIGDSGSANVQIDASQSKIFGVASPTTNLFSSGNSSLSFNIESASNNNPPVGGQGEEVVVVVPNIPPPADKPPIKVSQGTIVQLQSPSLGNSGIKKQKTEYLLNGGLVGTSEEGEDVPIDTSTLSPGTYKVTTKSYLEDGTIEESSQDIEVVEESIFSKYKVPAIIVSAIIIIVCIMFIIKKSLNNRLPKY